MIDELTAIVLGAGQIILKYYSDQNLPVQQKSDHSPVTIADLQSHDFISSELQRRFSFPVLSEENIIPFGTRQHWREFWLVDPLDGTKDFLAKNGEFTVNIALIRDSQPVLGIIYAPALGEIYWAEKGKGAFSRQSGKDERLPQVRTEELTVVRSRLHETPLTQEFLQRNKLTNVFSVGSALKFGRLAKGVANLYPRYGGSGEWDVAAGHVLINEAGGKIINIADGKEPIYNKEILKMGYFLAYARHIDITSLDLMRDLI